MRAVLICAGPSVLTSGWEQLQKDGWLACAVGSGIMCVRSPDRWYMVDSFLNNQLGSRANWAVHSCVPKYTPATRQCWDEQLPNLHYTTDPDDRTLRGFSVTYAMSHLASVGSTTVSLAGCDLVDKYAWKPGESHPVAPKMLDAIERVVMAFPDVDWVTLNPDSPIAAFTRTMPRPSTSRC